MPKIPTFNANTRISPNVRGESINSVGVGATAKALSNIGSTAEGFFEKLMIKRKNAWDTQDNLNKSVDFQSEHLQMAKDLRFKRNTDGTMNLKYYPATKGSGGRPQRYDDVYDEELSKLIEKHAETSSNEDVRSRFLNEAYTLRNKWVIDAEADTNRRFAQGQVKNIELEFDKLAKNFIGDDSFNDPEVSEQIMTNYQRVVHAASEMEINGSISIEQRDEVIARKGRELYLNLDAAAERTSNPYLRIAMLRMSNIVKGKAKGLELDEYTKEEVENQEGLTRSQKDVFLAQGYTDEGLINAEAESVYGALAPYIKIEDINRVAKEASKAMKNQKMQGMAFHNKGLISLKRKYLDGAEVKPEEVNAVVKGINNYTPDGAERIREISELILLEGVSKNSKNMRLMSPEMMDSQIKIVDTYVEQATAEASKLAGAKKSDLKRYNNSPNKQDTGRLARQAYTNTRNALLKQRTEDYSAYIQTADSSITNDFANGKAAVAIDKMRQHAKNINLPESDFKIASDKEVADFAYAYENSNPEKQVDGMLAIRNKYGSSWPEVAGEYIKNPVKREVGVVLGFVNETSMVQAMSALQNEKSTNESWAKKFPVAGSANGKALDLDIAENEEYQNLTKAIGAAATFSGQGSFVISAFNKTVNLLVKNRVIEKGQEVDEALTDVMKTSINDNYGSVVTNNGAIFYNRGSKADNKNIKSFLGKFNSKNEYSAITKHMKAPANLEGFLRAKVKVNLNSGLTYEDELAEWVTDHSVWVSSKGDRKGVMLQVYDQNNRIFTPALKKDGNPVIFTWDEINSTAPTNKAIKQMWSR